MQPVREVGRNPETSLDAVTADGDGQPVRAHGLQSFGIQTTTTGSPSGGTVALEGTIDGTNWFNMSADFTIGTDTSGDIKWAVDQPVAFARANLSSLAGGTDPTVTATIIGA